MLSVHAFLIALSYVLPFFVNSIKSNTAVINIIMIISAMIGMNVMMMLW